MKRLERFKRIKRFKLFIRRLALAVLLLWVADPAQAYESRPAFLRDVAFDQKVNDQVPLDLAFRNEEGERVRLGDYLGRKPVILALVYYRCQNLCSLVLDGLLRTLRALSFNAGEQFNVLAVSFDPREPPALAGEKKSEYSRRYGRPGAEAGWHFLTGEETSIQRLSQAAGFRYSYDGGKDQYAHATGVVILTPQGKISRYFYGIEFSPRDLRLGLVEASGNKIGSPIDQALLFCYRYDPVAGKYGAVIMDSVRLGGLATVLGLGVFIVAMVRRDRRQRIGVKRDVA